jgi:hypothetical protein
VEHGGGQRRKIAVLPSDGAFRRIGNIGHPRKQALGHGIRGIRIIFHIPGKHHGVARRVHRAISVVEVLIPSQLAEFAGTGIAGLIASIALNTHESLGMSLGMRGVENTHAHMSLGGSTRIGGVIDRAGKLQGDVGCRRPARIVIRPRDPHPREQIGIIAEQHIAGLGLQLGRAKNRDGGRALVSVNGNLGKRADADSVIDSRVANRGVNRGEGGFTRSAAKYGNNPVRRHHADGAGQFAVKVLLHLPGVGRRIIGQPVLVDRLGDHHHDRVNCRQHKHPDGNGNHQLHQSHAWRAGGFGGGGRLVGKIHGTDRTTVMLAVSGWPFAT